MVISADNITAYLTVLKKHKFKRRHLHKNYKNITKIVTNCFYMFFKLMRTIMNISYIDNNSSNSSNGDSSDGENPTIDDNTYSTFCFNNEYFSEMSLLLLYQRVNSTRDELFSAVDFPYTDTTDNNESMSSNVSPHIGCKKMHWFYFDNNNKVKKKFDKNGSIEEITGSHILLLRRVIINFLQYKIDDYSLHNIEDLLHAYSFWIVRDVRMKNAREFCSIDDICKCNFVDTPCKEVNSRKDENIVCLISSDMDITYSNLIPLRLIFSNNNNSDISKKFYISSTKGKASTSAAIVNGTRYPHNDLNYMGKYSKKMLFPIGIEYGRRIIKKRRIKKACMKLSFYDMFVYMFGRIKSQRQLDIQTGKQTNIYSVCDTNKVMYVSRWKDTKKIKYITSISVSLRSIKKIYASMKISKQTICPICIESPETNDTIEFCVTVRCRHLVCINCYERYTTIIRVITGQIKCPCCRRYGRILFSSPANCVLAKKF